MARMRKTQDEGKQPRDLKLALKCDIPESGSRAENVKRQSSSRLRDLRFTSMEARSSDKFCRFFFFFFFSYVAEDSEFTQ